MAQTAEFGALGLPRCGELSITIGVRRISRSPRLFKRTPSPRGARLPSMTLINFDHNATTPVLPEVAAAMADLLRQGYANPASQHQAGRRARRVLEDAREEMGRMLGAD